jgi:hypothetical protein
MSFSRWKLITRMCIFSHIDVISDYQVLIAWTGVWMLLAIYLLVCRSLDAMLHRITERQVVRWCGLSKQPTVHSVRSKPTGQVLLLGWIPSNWSRMEIHLQPFLGWLLPLRVSWGISLVPIHRREKPKAIFGGLKYPELFFLWKKSDPMRPYVESW